MVSVLVFTVAVLHACLATEELSSVFLPTAPQQEYTPTPDVLGKNETFQRKHEYLNEIDNDHIHVIDINGTIEEVQRILAANYSELPQLSRSEILEILDNITAKDQKFHETSTDSNSQIETVTTNTAPRIPVLEQNNTLQPENFKTPEEYMRAMRALMLVLPYNAKNLSYSEMKELYTKAPITRIVGERPGEVLTSPSITTLRRTTTRATTFKTTTTDNQQTSLPPNHHESYHQPFDLQPISSSYSYDLETTPSTIASSTTSTLPITSEYTTAKRYYKNRPNHSHRRRRPTSTTTTTTEPVRTVTENFSPFSEQQYIDKPSQTYQELVSAQSTTKLSPIVNHVTTIYPEKVSSYKTEQYYSTTKSGSTTTNNPQNTQESYSQSGHAEYISSNTKTQNPTNAQSQPLNAHTFRTNSTRRRTKPTRTTTVTEPTSTTQITSIGLDLPHEMKDVLANFNIDDHIPKTQKPFLKIPEESSTLFVTPAVEDLGSLLESSKYSSQYAASEVQFDKSTTQKLPMRDDVKEILASIGLFPDKEKLSDLQRTTRKTTTTTTTTTTETPDIEAAAESLSPEMKDLLVSFGLLPSANDIQQTSGQEEGVVNTGQAYDKQAASPVVDPSSYLNFKPLPLNAKETPDEEDDYLMNSDMKQFLASFGLVPSGPEETGPGEDRFNDQSDFHKYRSQKALKIENQQLENHTNKSADMKNGTETSTKPEKGTPHVNMDMLNDEMKEVLENLGFFPSSPSLPSEIKRKTNHEEGHIFNPSEHLASLNPTEEEAERLSKLLDTIKKLMKENATISQEEIDALNASISYILPSVPAINSSEYDQSTTGNENISPLFMPKKQQNNSIPLDQIKNAPDPLSLEELLTLVEENKNEVKRQQPNNDTSSTSSSSSSSSSSASDGSSTTSRNNGGVTEESTQDSGPSLTDLADSFGGGDTAPADASVDDALPPKKPNGLYFLLDWNTFLRVGEEGEKRTVNLQFTPKLGNSRAFQPVSVP